MRYVSSSAHPGNNRPGVVLLVVMAMLALFAALALSFVFYADAEAISSRLNMDQMVRTQADIDPEALAGYFLEQLLYDTDNIYSAMRGWSIARSMYGYNPAQLNFIAYNGVGRTALSYYDPDFSGVVGKTAYNTDNFNMVSYVTYHNPNPLVPGDQTLNFVRTPEFYNKVHFPAGTAPPSPSSAILPPLVRPANYQYVGGANPPWTAYDTNSLFLAQMDASGKVYMPSFYRPWTTQNLGTVPNNNAGPLAKRNLRAKLAKYMSLFPDSPYTNPDPNVWNPAFSLQDYDGYDVKNLEYGPGGNDSKWMDLGFPVMTAPNGKRYKALFAPLVADMSNKLHLWAHGNRIAGGNPNAPLHASNMGFGPSEVNLSKLPGASFGIQKAVEVKNLVTITLSASATVLTQPFTLGQSVVVAGVSDVNGALIPGYNGVQVVTKVNNVAPFSFQYVNAGVGLPAGQGGIASPTDLQSLFAYKYGGLGGLPASLPTGVVSNFKAGLSYSEIDADGRSSLTNVSNRPFYMPKVGNINGTIQPPLPVKMPAAGVTRTVTLPLPAVDSTGALPWYFFDAVKLGDTVVVDKLLPSIESVVVTAINPGASTFTAKFKVFHTSPVTVTSSPPVATGFPAYPRFPLVTGADTWDNTANAELVNNPLALNMFVPNGLNAAPLPTSNQESLARWGGTNGAALTSEVFRRMPNVFSDVRARNMVTFANWHLDRATGSPFLNFDRTDPTNVGYFTYNAAKGYPTLNTGNFKAVDYSKPAVPNNAVLSNSTTNPPWKTELSDEGGGAGWRSNLGNFLRVDLTRKLTAYPKAPQPALTQALTDRQQLATDIYNALVRVTGARDPNKPFVAQNLPSAGDYQAARWLAQLAVNIVDYIDNDDDGTGTNSNNSIMTAFPWHKTAAGVPVEYVFGTELPRLVLNEVYAQQETLTSPVNIWAELLNPLNLAAVAGSFGGGNAVLQNGVTPYYKIEIYASNQALTNWLKDPGNSQGAGGAVTGPVGAPPTGILLGTVLNWVPPGATAQTTQATTVVRAVNDPATIAPTISAPIPIAAYSANPAATGAHKVGTTVTIRTTVPHGLTAALDVGKAITIVGVNGQGPPAVPPFQPLVGYDGTFVISAIPSNKSFQYTAPAGVLPNGGVGTAIWVKNANVVGKYYSGGYYVVAPQTTVSYPAATPTRVPNLPATLATPQMSVPPPFVNIRPANANVALTGASVAGVNTVTIRIPGAGPLPSWCTVGAQVVVAGVGLPKYNSPPATTFTITSTTANTFTYVDPAAAGSKHSGGGTATLVISGNPNQGITLVLRRLADPNQPLNPATNPFITVDYINNVPVNGAGAITTFKASGRAQPYAADSSQTAPQAGAATPQSPQNSFLQQNSNATAPFDWLVHLDRPPVNPLELLFVSGYQPHQLTQKFVQKNAVTNVATAHQHYAPWNPYVINAAAATIINPTPSMADANALVYRALDQMSTRYMAGLYTGGRVPGNINLNTIMEPQIFQALCDAHDSPAAQYPNPWFTQANVNTVFSNILTQRGVSNTSAPIAEPLNKSFTSLSSTTQQGAAVPSPTPFMDNTWLGASGGTNPFAVGSANNHPYLQASLLQKIYNNITTTSNVFGVWWTVGYFEVVDETVQPPRLGQEIGRSQNANIRHRFFAVVDRSNMQLGSVNSTTAITAAAVTNANKNVPIQPIAMTYNAPTASNLTGNASQWNTNQSYGMSNLVFLPGGQTYFCIQPNMGNPPALPPANALYWKPLIMPGMLLKIDTGANAEVVTVVSTNANTFTAVFTKPHVAGVSMSCRGNPGPQANYNPHKDNNVVLHLSVIK